MKIKIKDTNLKFRVKKNEKGDWIDLAADTTTIINKNELKIITLGVAIELPKGFEAHVLPRSSTFKNYHIIMANSCGIIDNTYCGDNDIIGFVAYATEDTKIPRSARIAQLKIVPSQFATRWQKLKWLLSSKIKIEYVTKLNKEDRHGFGSTGL